MGSELLVTVYCITYNHIKYIRRCLESLVNQKTDFRYEIIVHDDNSTDGTREIVQEFAERYPDLVIPVLEAENQFSKGIRFVKSRMLPITHGKYLVECEGDDCWCDPEKLQLQVEALEAHPDCSICVHATDTVDQNGVPQPMHFPDIKIDHAVIGTEEFMKYVLNEGRWLFHLSSLMVSTESYREYKEKMAGGFPSKFYNVGDLPIFLYYSMRGNVYFIDRVMSLYTVESGGIMSRIKSDPEFAKKVHRGYINGLEAFDEYSGYRFHEGVTAVLVKRRFEVDRLDRRYDKILRTPEYRPLVKQRGLRRSLAFFVMGHLQLLFGKKDRKEE